MGEAPSSRQSTRRLIGYHHVNQPSTVGGVTLTQQKREALSDEHRRPSEMGRLHFVEAVLPPLQVNGLQMPAAALKLGLPDGVHLELSHRDQLPLAVALIKALQG